MQLLNIKIRNFRQYKDVDLELAYGEGNKLTVILGENGYGKTTLIRAFVWCLYGENTFKDQILLNKDVAISMNENDIQKVEVRTDLKHNDCRYRISRYENYKHNGSNVVKEASSTLSVQRDGKPISYDKAQIEINKILKQDLKDYFFYDGEHNRIEASVDRRSIKDTISQMMGIKRIESLREYFKPVGTYTVTNSLTNKMKGDALELNPLMKEKDELLQKKSDLLSDVKGYDDEVLKLTQQYNEKESLIKVNDQVKEKQIEKERLQKEINEIQLGLDDDFSNMISTIQPKSTSQNKNSLSFLKILYAQCFKQKNIENLALSSNFGSENSLSHISEEAVDQLIQRGTCLCGAIIKGGNDAYKHLQEAKEHMEPHDFGKYLSDFNESEQSNVTYAYDYIQNSRTKIEVLLDNIELIEKDKELLDIVKKRYSR